MWLQFTLLPCNVNAPHWKNALGLMWIQCPNVNANQLRSQHWEIVPSSAYKEKSMNCPFCFSPAVNKITVIFTKCNDWRGLTLHVLFEVVKEVWLALDRHQGEHDVIRLEERLEDLPGAHGVHVEVGEDDDALGAVAQNAEKVTPQFTHVHLDTTTWSLTQEMYHYVLLWSLDH